MTEITDALKRRRRLIAIKREHDLTYAGIAELAGASIKTVEGWLATPGTAGYNPIPAYRLDVILDRIKLRKLKEVKQP